MLTLHKVIGTTRNGLKWIGIVAGTAIIIYLLFRLGGFLKETFFPTPPPPPTVTFGKLPEINFPKSTISHDSFTYEVKTLSGFLPAFSDRLLVNKISHNEPNLLDLQRAKTSVAGINFNSLENKLSDTQYEWSDNTTLSRKIVMDIVSRNFIYETNFLSYSPVSSSSAPITKERAIEDASEFFSTMSSLPSVIDPTLTKTESYGFREGRLIPAVTAPDTNLIRVDFFRNKINNLPVYHDHPLNSLIYAMVTPFRQVPVVEARYTYHQVTEISATYPIKTAQEAFEELQSGRAYIAAYYGDSSNIEIEEVTLAYYLSSDVDQEYVMPIVVFMGKDGFFAYVSAIKDDWIE